MVGLVGATSDFGLPVNQLGVVTFHCEDFQLDKAKQDDEEDNTFAGEPD